MSLGASPTPKSVSNFSPVSCVSAAFSCAMTCPNKIKSRRKNPQHGYVEEKKKERERELRERERQSWGDLSCTPNPTSNVSKVEQPSSSLLPQCPYMAHVMTNMMPAFACRTWLGAFQHWCAKPTLLFGSWWFGRKPYVMGNSGWAVFCQKDDYFF